MLLRKRAETPFQRLFVFQNYASRSGVAKPLFFYFPSPITKRKTCSCTPDLYPAPGGPVHLSAAARSIREAEPDTLWGVRVLAFTSGSLRPSPHVRTGVWGHSGPPHQNHPAAPTNAEMSPSPPPKRLTASKAKTAVCASFQSPGLEPSGVPQCLQGKERVSQHLPGKALGSLPLLGLPGQAPDFTE